MSSEDRVQALRPATGIIVTYRGSTEESASGHVETREEEYVCLRNGEYRRIRMAWTKKFLPFDSYSSILSDEPITATEYAQAAQGRQVEDTPELLALMKRKGEVQKELEDMRPCCPKCKRSMAYRYSSKTKKYFWGCPIFPNCTGLRNITEAQQQKIAEAEKIGVNFLR